MAGAVQRGLSLSDLDNLTLGQFVDYVVTYMRAWSPQKSRSIGKPNKLILIDFKNSLVGVH